MSPFSDQVVILNVSENDHSGQAMTIRGAAWNGVMPITKSHTIITGKIHLDPSSSSSIREFTIRE